MTQSAINDLMVGCAEKYAMVVRLKGGDPMLFGRADEELQALRKAGIAFEVVPGVPAASAASAALEIPLTQRGIARSVALVTSRCAPGASANGWARAATAADAGAIYMGAGTAAKVARELVTAGKSQCTPVAIVTNASLSEQEVQFTTLGSLARDPCIRARGPAVILFGPQFADPRNMPKHDAATAAAVAWVAA